MYENTHVQPRPYKTSNMEAITVAATPSVAIPWTFQDPNCAGAAFGELEADADAKLVLAEPERLVEETEADEADGAVAVEATEELLADPVAAEVDDSEAAEVALALLVKVRDVMTVKERPDVLSQGMFERRESQVDLLRVLIGGLPEDIGGTTVGRGITLELVAGDGLVQPVRGKCERTANLGSSWGLATARPKETSRNKLGKAVVFIVVAGQVVAEIGAFGVTG
jgi:hypothetical protein